MSQYPTLGMYVAPPTYSYQASDVKVVRAEEPIEQQPILVEQAVKSHPLAALAEELEHPSQSIPFLELF